MRNYTYKRRTTPRKARSVGMFANVSGRERKRGTDPQRHFPDTAGIALTTPKLIQLPRD